LKQCRREKPVLNNCFEYNRIPNPAKVATDMPHLKIVSYLETVAGSKAWKKLNRNSAVERSVATMLL